MFGTIRKHQGWLWAVIAGLTILSFVVFGPTNTKMGNALKRQGNYGVIGGKAITFDQTITAQHELALDTFLKTQQWPNPKSVETMRQVYYRIFFVQKLDEMNVKISTEAAANFARRLLGNTSMDEFVEKVLRPQGMDAGDFDRFLRHELAIEQLVMSAGVSGKLATPQEAETMYRLEHQDLDTLIVEFSATNYMNGVQVTPEVISQYYSNQIANYRVPEQVQVNYVKYEATNFYPTVQASLTNLDQLVDTAAQRLGTNFYHGATNLAESKVAIRTEILREHALVEARRVAGAFAEALDQGAHTNTTLASLAAKSNLNVRMTAPFDRDYGPQDITVPADFTRKAFSLADTDPFGGPLLADDGIYVIALVRRIAPTTPALAEINAKVTADYKYVMAVQYAQQAAVHFASVLTNATSANKSFQAICAEEKVKYESLPPFSLSTQSLPGDIENHINFSTLKQVAFSTPKGQASQVAGARDGAFLLYIDKEVPLDESKVKAELPAFLAELRRVRQNEAFNLWFNSQWRQDPDFVSILQSFSESPTGKTSATRRPTS